MRGKAELRAPEVFLAAFGKHPGWDDHIEDIGIETDRLASLKQLLYVQGIGGQIDAGAWEGLPGVQRVQGFAHVFVRRTPEDVILGRMWSSVDGKGRTKYPMVVCAQCSGVPLTWAVREVLPRLREIQDRCQAVRTAAEVLTVMDEARAELRGAVAQAAFDSSDTVISPGAVADLAEHAEMGDNHEGIHRILYLLERESAAYLRGRLAEAARSGQLRPIQVRVPRCGEAPVEVVAQWFDFMLSRLDPAAEIWAVLPLDQPWMDIFVGSPVPQQFFCLQASREAIPLASDIPYSLDEEFVARAERIIAAWRDGSAEPIVVRAEAPRPARRPLKDRIDLPGRLAALRGQRSLRLALIVIAAAVAALVLLIVLVSLWPSGTKRQATDGKRPGETVMSPADAKAWEDLCMAFQGWFGIFLSSVDGARLDRWRADEHLRQHVVDVVQRIRAGRLTLDPREFPHVGSANLSFLAKNAPRSVRSPEMIARTREALAVVRQVERALSGEAWPAVKRLRELAAAYRQRGWNRPADHLEDVTGALAPGDDLAAQVDETLTVAARAEATDSLWQETRQQSRILNDSGSSVLGRFEAHVLARTHSEAGEGGAADLDELATQLARAKRLADMLAAFVQGDWKSKVDRQLVEADPPVAAPSDPAALKDEGTFLRWLAAVQDDRYARLDPSADPREQGGWQDRQDKALAAIAGKIDQVEAKGGRQEAPGLRQKLQDLRRQLEDIRSLRWDRVHKPRIAQDVDSFAAGPAALDREAGAVLARLIGGREAYLASLPASVCESDAVNAHWRKRLGELKAIEDLGQLAARAAQLEADLKRLEGELAKSLGEPSLAQDWYRQLATRAFRSHRDAVLGRALERLTWRDAAAVRDEAFEAEWRTLRAEFDRWCADVRELSASLAGVEAALIAGALPDEKPAGADRTIAEVCSAWRDRAVCREEAVREAIQPIVARVERLEAVTKLTDRGQLVRAAGQAVQGSFEVARAGWKRLGELPGVWPATAAELDQEIEIHRSLSAVYSLIPDAARRDQLVQELAGGGRRRWSAYFASRRQPAEFEDAIERMDELGLSPDEPEGLPPMDQFRLRLHRFRRRVLRDPGPMEEAAVRKLVGDFIADVSRLPGEAASQAPVKGFVSELTQIAEAKDSGADFGKAGPGTSGWTVAAAAGDAGSVRFAWGDRHAMTFVRIQPEGGQAAYLAATEVSLGLFIDVVQQRQRWRDVRKVLRTYSGSEGDPRGGPRTWEIAPGSSEDIRDARSWCRLPHGVTLRRFYAPNIDPGAPGRGHPMQYVSVQAALYLARLVGCRLPTSAEWAAARQVEVRSGAQPNLRDQTWLKQRDHIAREIEGKGIPADEFYPDGGIFWPKGVEAAGKLVGRNALALPTDDGILWFAEVDAGKAGPFNHLAGNVAEFVFEDAAAAGGVPAALADVEAVLRKSSDGIRVIGGSALSPPDLKVDAPCRADYGEASSGFSDVGFRLSFTAPAEPVHARLRRLLTDRGYLPGQ